MAWALGVVIGAASLSANSTAVCTNSSVFSMPERTTVTLSDAGVETAGYTVERDSQQLIVRENSIARTWRRARAFVLSDGRTVLRATENGGVTYAFPRLEDPSKPLLIISGNMLKGDRSDMELLKRFRVTDWLVAEKDPTCTRVLHYGWDNVLGAEK